MLTHEFPPFRGGIATYTAQLAAAAHELGHEVVVVAPDFGQSCTSSDKEEYPFQIERYPATAYNYRKLPALLWRTSRQSRKTDYDLLHAVDPSYVMAMAFINHFGRVPFVATAHGTEILALRVSRQAALLRTGDLFERASTVFTNSEFTKSLLVTHCTRVDTNRIRVTPLGVDDYWFGNAGDIAKTRDQLGIPRDHKVILTVARLDERKGHQTVFKGIAQLSGLLKRNMTYVVVGNGADKAYSALLHQLAQTCGCNVVFVDNASRELLRQLYASADIFCMPGELHPKKVEGFGLAYLEAAAQGVPSIGSSVGAVPEVVLHENTGLIVEPGNELLCSRSLDLLLTDNSYRQKLGNNARVWAKKFTWHRCADLTYRQVGNDVNVLETDVARH